MVAAGQAEQSQPCCQAQQCLEQQQLQLGAHVSKSCTVAIGSSSSSSHIAHSGQWRVGHNAPGVFFPTLLRKFALQMSLTS
jgi:hypothetical protein